MNQGDPAAIDQQLQSAEELKQDLQTKKEKGLTQKKPPCVDSKRLRVYLHHAHMCHHMRAWCRYTRGRFQSTHGGFWDGHTDERGERRERGGGSPSVLLTEICT